MKQKITIDILLPSGTPDSIIERSYIEIIKGFIRTKRLLPMRRCFVDCLWIEKNKIRKKADISYAGRKIIVTALIESGIIASDDWRHIIGFRDNYAVDRLHPGIHLCLDDYEPIADNAPKEVNFNGIQL